MKVTSVASTSGAPTPPYPTPHTEAHEELDSPPAMDFTAVGNILAPIQEHLNETANEAMYPSPPINTPEAFSPAPSVYKYGRGRGLSLISDRLAQLKLEHHVKTPPRDRDVESSNRSVVPSVDEENEGEDDEVLSDYGGNRPGLLENGTSSHQASKLTYSLSVGSIPIALGSPTANPRLEEYLSFTSKDLPVTAPGSSIAPFNYPAGHAAQGTASILANRPTSMIEASNHGDKKKSPTNSIKSDGVTEKSNWGEELEDCFIRTCMRLEQLACDEHEADSSKSIREYYIARLSKLLGDESRQVPVKVSAAERAAKSE